MKIIRGLAALFIVTSMILPSIAYADEKTTAEVDVEKNVGQNSETENLLEEEASDDSLPETDESIVEESAPVENLETEELVDESLLENKESLEEKTDEPEEETEQETIEEESIVEHEIMSVKSSIIESKISLLGHLKTSTVRIYKDLNKPSNYVQAGSTYINAVYYIKKQANYNGESYYLISKNASSTSGVVGWVKSKDLSTNAHVGVNRTAKTYYVKGTGSAYAKAWGGSKDIVFNKLSDLKGQQFKINLTERVGKNTWHRGILNGKTVWVHSSYLTQSIGTTTSRLGHLKSKSTRIYDSYTTPTKFVVAGSSYTNEVYYIKRKASNKGITYYLISRNASSTKGVIGWVKATDLSTNSHKGVDRTAKMYYFKGGGTAYTKAWGGSKNINVSKLTSRKGDIFKINLTEKIGNNIWYRGTLNGKTAWVHSAYLSKVPSKPAHINGVLIASKKYPLPKNYAPGESKQARSAFNQMAAAGKRAGYNLTAFSTYRSYAYQKGLFDRYAKQNGVKEANRFSARPGQSEHQTGLAFDVGEVGKQGQWASQAFGNTNAGKWMAKNAHHSGFIVRYPKGKEAMTGYIYEPWHLRYVGKELATKVYKSGLTLEEYLGA